jgi:hypothetical protein
MTVDGQACPENLTLAASAGFGVSAFQVFNVDSGFLSTVTKTNPLRPSGISDGDELVEAQASDIDERGHNGSFPSGCVKWRLVVSAAGRRAFIAHLAGVLQ